MFNVVPLNWYVTCVPNESCSALKSELTFARLVVSVDILEVEVKQYSAMKQVAKKIGIDTKKYDNLIKEARIRVFGEDAVREYFSN